MPSKSNKEKNKSIKPDKTILKGISWLGTYSGFNIAAVDIKNGKIVRIRPLHYDWKYKNGEIQPWKMEVRGKVFEPKMKTLLPPLTMAYKKRVYSPNRIKYPLKRIDWDPNGERNPENRGKSKYKRISWDEATDLIAGELKRVQKKYGPSAVLMQSDDHGETKVVHASHYCPNRLLNIMGGFTKQMRNPDSWEGWYWGAKHMWGMDPFGLMAPQGNIFLDVAKHTGMLLYWGCDPETTVWYRSGQAASRFSYWFTELGIKCVYVCPDLNYGAAVHADKWIPVLPNTDAALHLAITYLWITEDTYDKEYIATHTVGFEKFKDYVLGKEDGIPKTPKWASPKCGVPVWTIKALARQWASITTSTIHFCGGGKIRGPFSHEPARLEVANLAMQGLGKPGVHQVTTVPPIQDVGHSTITSQLDPCVMRAWRADKKDPIQHIPQTHIHKAILEASYDSPISWYSAGQGAKGKFTKNQFEKHVYPMPKEEGGGEVHMIWTDGPCLFTCWNGSSRMVDAYRSPKIECIVAQHPWLENDCLFADIILPINTKLEEEDIGADVGSMQYALIHLEEKGVEPLGESKSDYEAVGEIAKKLGAFEEYTGGKTVEEWIKHGYETSGVQEMVTWEELSEKGYYVVPGRKNWEKDSAGMIDFYNDPDNHPLATPSGKIEFYSERLAKHFPDDYERPPVPKWIEKSESHDESLSSERAKEYPLLIMTNHGRWRIHAQCDDIPWTREISTCKVEGADGYMYEPCWLNPITAAERGIKDGDIVRVYNQRGSVLCGARVWERVMPGVAYVDHGARTDWVIPGELDRGGAINLISPEAITSKNCAGQATTGYLVEVEAVTMAQMGKWKDQYPDAFKREYHPGSGLRFDAWIEKGGE